MKLQEFLNTIRPAYRERNYPECFALLDDFLATAEGSDRAEALVWKADVIYSSDPRRAAEVLIFVDEELLQARNPLSTLRLLTVGLRFCHLMGDIDKAKRYETLSHHLLQTLPDDSPARASQFRLHMNLGAVAMLRGEHAAAYWHYLQGISGLNAYGSDDDTDIRLWLFFFYRQVAEVCIDMRRQPEAEEALAKAQTCVISDRLQIYCTITRVRLLAEFGTPEEADALLGEMTPTASWDPEVVVDYHLLKGLAAQSLGDLRGFHTHLSLAHQNAIEHQLDYLLCKIQRVQRTPVRLGAVK